MTDRKDLLQRFLGREVTVKVNGSKCKVHGRLVTTQESRHEPGHPVDLLLLSTGKGFILLRKWDWIDIAEPGDGPT